MIVAGPFGTFQYGEPFVAVAYSSAGALTVNTSLGPVTQITLGSNITNLDFSNFPAAGRTGTHSLQIIQGGAGSYTIGWDAAITWGTAGAPTLSTAVGDFDWITFITTDAGTTVAGMVAGQGFS